MTFLYENWIAFNEGESWKSSFEVPLFTDARITGQIDGLGPYKFLNPLVVDAQKGVSKPSIVFFFEDHVTKRDVPDMSHTDTTRYHGGLLVDEAAAITSLVVGIRLKAGGMSRIFLPGEDEKGQVVGWDSTTQPEISTRKYGTILPSALGDHNIDAVATRMETLLQLTVEDNIALVRAARLYQDALWIAESEPNLSWLFLVSALEVAANRWREDDGEPIDRMKVWNPELSSLLERQCEDGTAITVADAIVSTLGATKKFIDYVMKFLPDPPSERPTDAGPLEIRHPWEPEKIKKSLGIIYGHRSKALHDGTPFPAPMCDVPLNDPPEEKPIGTAAGSRGGIWSLEDMPMLLHLFEYIARHCLLNWWDSMNEGVE